VLLNKIGETEMKHIHIDAWEVTQSDFAGMGESTVAYFSNKVDADKLVEGNKWQSVTKVMKTFVIMESLEDYTNFSKEKLRASALAKLSAQEKEALGLK
jgi:hypothetical protein